MPTSHQTSEAGLRPPVRPPILGRSDSLKSLELANLSGRPREEDFIGKPYSMAEVQADLSRVASLIARMERDKKQEGYVLEGVVAKGINDFKWLGPHAVWNQTTEFDDIVNGVDGVVEFYSGPDKHNSMWALAIDVTENFGRILGKGIRPKLGQIKAGLQSGEMGKVKYFRPNRPGLQMRGEWRGLPKMLLVGSGNLEELQRLKRHQQQASGALEKDPVAMDLLIQLRIQAQVYAEYCRSLGKNHSAVIFKNIDERLEQIFKTKFPKAVYHSKDFATNPNDLGLLSALSDLGYKVDAVKL